MKSLSYACLLLQLIFTLLCKPAVAHIRPVNLECITGSAQMVLPIQQLFQHISLAPESDPSRLSLLIAAALNQRYGTNIQAEDIAGLMIPPSGRGQIYSFLDIKTVIKKAGYSVSAYRINGSTGHPVFERNVGFLIDKKVSPNNSIITLLFASGSGSKYLLYANGILCPMSDQQFARRFSDSVFLSLD